MDVFDRIERSIKWLLAVPVYAISSLMFLVMIDPFVNDELWFRLSDYLTSGIGFVFFVCAAISIYKYNRR